MKLAVLSDIHGNCVALEAVLKAIDDINVDRIYCLGDIVGYGAQPNECCELIKGVTDKIVLGNHDSAASGEMDFSWFNPVAKQSLEWTSNELSDENKEFLRNLPYSIEEDDLIFSHAVIHKKEEFYYDDELIPIYYSFKEMEDIYRISFIGHSHKYNILKALADTNRLSKWGAVEDIVVEEKFKYIVNAGSVGQPRDKNPESCFITYDTSNGAGKINMHRVKYDVEEAAKRILDNSLPTILAERLFLGI